MPLLSVDELLVNRHGFPIRYLFFGNVGKSAAVGSGLSSGGGDVSSMKVKQTTQKRQRDSLLLLTCSDFQGGHGDDSSLVT